MGCDSTLIGYTMGLCTFKYLSILEYMSLAPVTISDTMCLTTAMVTGSLVVSNFFAVSTMEATHLFAFRIAFRNITFFELLVSAASRSIQVSLSFLCNSKVSLRSVTLSNP